jgi:hypothetical protein
MSQKRKARNAFIQTFKLKFFSLGEWARLEDAFDAGWRAAIATKNKRTRAKP